MGSSTSAVAICGPSRDNSGTSTATSSADISRNGQEIVGLNDTTTYVSSCRPAKSKPRLRQRESCQRLTKRESWLSQKLVSKFTRLGPEVEKEGGDTGSVASTADSDSSRRIPLKPIHVRSGQSSHRITMTRLLHNVGYMSKFEGPMRYGTLGIYTTRLVIPIVCDENKLPVVAAVEYGDGRVVAFGHTGFFNNLTFEGVAEAPQQLITNCICWVSEQKRKTKEQLKILCLARLFSEIVTRLVKEEIECTVYDIDLYGEAEAYSQTLADYDVVIVFGNQIDSVQGSIESFIRNGGGLLIADNGWEWYNYIQRDHKDNPINQVFGGIGLYWSSHHSVASRELYRLRPERIVVVRSIASAMFSLIYVIATTEEQCEDSEDLARAITCLCDTRNLPASCLIPKLLKLMDTTKGQTPSLGRHPLVPCDSPGADWRHSRGNEAGSVPSCVTGTSTGRISRRYSKTCGSLTANAWPKIPKDMRRRVLQLITSLGIQTPSTEQPFVGANKNKAVATLCLVHLLHKMATELGSVDVDDEAADQGAAKASARNPAPQHTVLEMPVPTPGWYSTGVYAREQERIRVHCSRAWNSFGVQVGCLTTNSLTRPPPAGGNFMRWAEEAVYERFTRLADTGGEGDSGTGTDGSRVTIASPYEGPVYVHVEPFARGQRFGEQSHVFDIVGGLAAPRFILGKSDSTSWKRELKSATENKIQWVEFESDTLVMCFPRDVAGRVEDPTAMLSGWQDILMHLSCFSAGFPPFNKIRIVLDPQANTFATGYPVVVPVAYYPLVVSPQPQKTNKNLRWQLLRAVAGIFVNPVSVFSGLEQALPDIFVIDTMARLYQAQVDDVVPDVKMTHRNGYWQLHDEPHQDASDSAGVNSGIRFLLRTAYYEAGRDAFSKVLMTIKRMRHSELPVTDAEKISFWIENLSVNSNKHMGGLFGLYGLFPRSNTCIQLKENVAVSFSNPKFGQNTPDNWNYVLRRLAIVGKEGRDGRLGEPSK